MPGCAAMHLHSTHTQVWLGDLNYRIRENVPDADIRALCKRRHFASLAELDQLTIERGPCLYPVPTILCTSCRSAPCVSSPRLLSASVSFSAHLSPPARLLSCRQTPRQPHTTGDAVAPT